MLACLVELAEVVAFRNHWQFHYWHLPDLWVPFHLILFPFNFAQDLSWFWGTFAAFYWPLASVTATVLFWSVLTWPIEVLVKRVNHSQDSGVNGLATWKELVGLLAATAILVLLSYFMLKAYPFK